MPTVLPPICQRCKHLIRPPRLNYPCEGFPRGVPIEIITSEFDHHNPHPDDNGIQFEPLDDDGQDE